MEMPRFRSSSIQSDVVARWFLRAVTEPASCTAPPYNSNFSVNVVLPASGCEMIAKVRRREISCSIVSIDGEKVVVAKIVAWRAVEAARKRASPETGWLQGKSERRQTLRWSAETTHLPQLDRVQVAAGTTYGRHWHL